MSHNGTRLAISEAPDAADLEQYVRAMVAAWPNYTLWKFRGQWLAAVELRFQRSFPLASAADLRLTARGLAPFALLDGPNVP